MKQILICILFLSHIVHLQFAHNGRVMVNTRCVRRSSTDTNSTSAMLKKFKSTVQIVRMAGNIHEHMVSYEKRDNYLYKIEEKTNLVCVANVRLKRSYDRKLWVEEEKTQPGGQRHRSFGPIQKMTKMRTSSIFGRIHANLPLYASLMVLLSTYLYTQLRSNQRFL